MTDLLGSITERLTPDVVTRVASQLGESDASQARAQSVMQALTMQGIASNRLEAEGYGDKHPVADNTTPEGRAKNRRIALRVTAK